VSDWSSDVCSSDLFGVRRLCISMSLLSIDPPTYIEGTVSEFDSLGFAEGKELHSFAGDENDLLEIDGHSALFPAQQVSKQVHMLGLNPAAYEPHHTVFSPD